MNIQICDFRPEWRAYFEQFNKAWIEKYFELEPIDQYVLSSPEEAILNDGGRILFALYGQQVIGTVALKYIDQETMELTKMAVDTNYQGMGAGELLGKSAIALAKEGSMKKLVLYTQTKLKPALNLYSKLGFREVPVEPGKYKRADTKMEMVFNDSPSTGKICPNGEII